MTSKSTSDLPFCDGDLPTSRDDVRALREYRPNPGSDWLDVLTTLARQVPRAAAKLRRRRTFAGLAPFEL
jgi:hypothetical protein